MQFNEYIKTVRKSRHMTQDQFASVCKVSKRSIEFYEKGLRKPNYSTLVNMSKSLNIPVSEIMPDEFLIDDNCGHTENISYYEALINAENLSNFLKNPDNTTYEKEKIFGIIVTALLADEEKIC